MKWISNTLQISYGETYAAVNRLIRLELIKIDQNGNWVSSTNTTAANQFSAQAFRKLQKQILEKAIIALDETEYSERDQSSITMCISKDRLPEAKEKIKKFRRELMQFLEGGEEKDEVYQMSISLFPVTKTKKKGAKQ